jgi:integrase
MAVSRQPNGKWQGSYYAADRSRITKVFRLKTEAKRWAEEGMAAVRSGEHRDPRAGRTTVAAWHGRWSAARVVSTATGRRNASHWKNHVGPAWGGRPVGSIEPIDVQLWVRRMMDAGTGTPTIHASVDLLSGMLKGAVRHHLIQHNPCEGLLLPKIVTQLPRWFTVEEVAAILKVVEEPWRTLIDLACHVGLRWGELAGLHCYRIGKDRSRIEVRDVMTRDGLREYPKSRRSRREVPVPPHIRGPLDRLVSGRPDDALVFTTSRGRPVGEANFRQRVWAPALKAAGVPYARPHIMRHTAASWLVQAGVDLERVQAILGHEDYRTTKRYAHLRPGAHDVVLDAWATLGRSDDATTLARLERDTWGDDY